MASSSYFYVGITLINSLLLLHTFPAVGYSDAPLIAQAETEQPSHSSRSILFVDAASGDDQASGTMIRSPLRTITHALAIAEPGTVILVAPGTYSTETGETFPLQVPANVTLQVDPSVVAENSVVLYGGGVFLTEEHSYQNISIFLADQAQLIGMTVINPNTEGYGIWVESGQPRVQSVTVQQTATGLLITGESRPIVQRSLFRENQISGLAIYGTAQPQILSNTFQNNQIAVSVAQNAIPTIADNQIRQNVSGLVIQSNAQPVLRQNTIAESQQDGLIAIAQSLPDLGTAEEAGENIFLDNDRYDINASTIHTIPAAGNTLSDRITGLVDLSGRATPTATAFAPSTTFQTALNDAIDRWLPPSSPSEAISSDEAIESTMAADLSNEATASESRATEPDTAVNTAEIARANSFLSLQSTPESAAEGIAAEGITADLPALELVAPPDLSAEAFPVPTITAVPTLEAILPNESRAALLETSPPATRSADVSTTPTAIEIPVIPAPETTSTAPTVPSAQPAAIEIPVIPPTTTIVPSLSASQLDPSNRFAPSSAIVNRFSPSVVNETAAVEIPVPPPNSSQVSLPQSQPIAIAPTTPVSRFSPTPTTTPANTASNSVTDSVLPVPSSVIPVGNAGDMPRVDVASTFNQTRSTLPGVNQAAASLNYRVVAAADPRTQSVIQAIVPNAFLTQVQGQSVLQVGVFTALENAQDIVQVLQQYGISSVIWPIE